MQTTLEKKEVKDLKKMREEFFALVPGVEKASPVPVVDAASLTERSFKKKWVSKSRPVLIKGAVKEWPAVRKWGDKNYWLSQVENIRLKVYTHMNYNNDKYQHIGEEEMFFHDAVERLYANTDYVLSIPARKMTPKNAYAKLIADLPGFPFLPNVKRPRLIPQRRFFMYRRAATAWHYHDIDETLMCQIKGTKTIVIFPPDVPQIETITRFFLDDEYVEGKQLDKSLDIPMYIVDVEDGDALYIPPYWHHGVIPNDGEIGFTVAYCWPSPWHVMGNFSSFFVRDMFKRKVWPSKKYRLLVPLVRLYAGLSYYIHAIME